MGRAEVIRADIERIESMSGEEFEERWGAWARSQDRDVTLMRARWISDLRAMLPHAEREDEAGVELVAAKDAYKAKPTDKSRARRDAAVAAIQAIRLEERSSRSTLAIAGDAFVSQEG